jgi:hypothetical protein
MEDAIRWHGAIGVARVVGASRGERAVEALGGGPVVGQGHAAGRASKGALRPVRKREIVLTCRVSSDHSLLGDGRHLGARLLAAG